jgi:hypothetical protein
MITVDNRDTQTLVGARYTTCSDIAMYMQHRGDAQFAADSARAKLWRKDAPESENALS